MIKLCRTQLVWILICALEYVVSTNACSSHNSIWNNINNPQLRLAPHADFGSGKHNACHLMCEVATRTSPTCKKWYGQHHIYNNSKLNTNSSPLVSSLKIIRNKNIGKYNGRSMRLTTKALGTDKFQLNKSNVKNQINNIINEKSMTFISCNDIDKEFLQEISSKNSRQREKIYKKIDKPLNFVNIDNYLWKPQPSFIEAIITNKFDGQPSEYHNDIKTTRTEKYNYLTKKVRKDTINWKYILEILLKIPPNYIVHRINNYNRYINAIFHTLIPDEIPRLKIEVSDQIHRKTIYQEITPDIVNCQAQMYHSNNSMSITEPKTTYDSYYNIPIGNINIIYGPLFKNESLKAILKKIYLIILNGFKPYYINNGVYLWRLKRPLEQNTLKILIELPSNRLYYMLPTYGPPDLWYANNLTNGLKETFSTLQELSNNKSNMLYLDINDGPSFFTSYQTNKQVGPYIPIDDDMKMIYIPLYRTCHHQLPKPKSSLKYNICDKLLQDNEERKICAQRNPQIICRWPLTTTSNPHAIDFSSSKSSVYLPTSTAKSTLIPIQIPYLLPYCCYCYKSDLHKISTDTRKIFQQPDIQSNVYNNLMIKSEKDSNLKQGVPKLKKQPLEVLMNSENFNINNLKNILKEINHPLHTELDNTPNLNNLKLNNIIRHPILKIPYNFENILNQSNDLGVMDKSYYMNYNMLDSTSKSHFFDKSPELSFESQIFPSNKHSGLSLLSPIQSNGEREYMKWIRKYRPIQLLHANDIETPSTDFSDDYTLDTSLSANSEPQASICPPTIILSSDYNLTMPIQYTSSINTLIRPNKSTATLDSRAKSNLKIDHLFATPHNGNIMSLPITNQPIVKEGTNLLPSLKKFNKLKSQKAIPLKSLFFLKDFGIYKKPQYSTSLPPLIIRPESHLAPNLDPNFLYPPCRYKINSIPNKPTSDITQSDLVHGPHQKQYRPIYSKSDTDRIQIKVPKTDESDILKQSVPKYFINSSWLTPSLPSQKKSPTKNANIIPFSNQVLSEIPCQKRYKPKSSFITPNMENFMKKFEPSLQYISTKNKNPRLKYRTTAQSPSEYFNPKNNIVFKTPIEVFHPVAQEHNSRKSLEPTREILDQTSPINEITQQKDTILEVKKLCEDLNQNMPVSRTVDLEPTYLGLQNLGLTQKTPTYYNVDKAQSANVTNKVIFRQPSLPLDSQIFDKPLGHPVETIFDFAIPENLHMHVPKTWKTLTDKEIVPYNQLSTNTPAQPCFSNQVVEGINREPLQFVSKIPGTYASQTKQTPKYFKIDKPNAKGDIKHKILYKYPTIPSYSQIFESSLQQSPIKTDLQHNQLPKTVETIQSLLSLPTFPTQSSFIGSQNSQTLVPEKSKSMYDQSQLSFNQIRLVPLESENYNLNQPVLYYPSILDSSVKPNNSQAISQLDPKITSKSQPETNMLVNVSRTENAFSLPLIVRPIVQEEVKPTTNLLDNYKQISKQNLPYNLQPILKDFRMYKNSQYLSPLTSLSSGPESQFPPCLDPNFKYPPCTSNEYPKANKVLSGTIPSIITESNQRQDRPIIYCTCSKNTNQIKCNQRIHEIGLVPKKDKKVNCKLPVSHLFSQLSPSILYQEYPQTKHINGEIIPSSNQTQSLTLSLQNTYNPTSTSEQSKQPVATVHMNPPMNHRTPVQSPSAQDSPRNKIKFETSNESMFREEAQEQIVRINLEPPRETLDQTKEINKITQPMDLAAKTQKYKDTNRYKPGTMTKDLEPINVDLQQLDKPQTENDINRKLLFKQHTLPLNLQLSGIPLEQAPVETIINSKLPQNSHIINSIPVKTFADILKVHTKQLSTDRPSHPYSPNQNVQKLNTDPLQLASRPLLTLGSQFKQIPKYIKTGKPEVNDVIKHKISLKHPTLPSDAQSFRIPFQQTHIETSYNSPNLKESPHLSSTSTFPTQSAVIASQNHPTLVKEKYKNVHNSIFNQPQLPLSLAPIESENYNLNQPMLRDTSILQSSTEPTNLPALASRIISKLQPETKMLVNMPHTENLISLPLTEKPIIQEEIKPTSPLLDNDKQRLSNNLESVLKDFGIYKDPQYLSPLNSLSGGSGAHFQRYLDPHLIYPPSTSNKYPIAKKVHSGTIHSITTGSNQRQDRPKIYSTRPTDTNQLKTNEPVYENGLVPNTDEKNIDKLRVPKYPVNSSWLSPSLLSKKYSDIKRNNAEIIPSSRQILRQITPSQNIEKPISSFKPLSLDSLRFGIPLARAPIETICNSPISKNVLTYYPSKTCVDKQLSMKTPDEPYSSNEVGLVQETAKEPPQFVSKTPSAKASLPKQRLRNIKINNPDVNSDIKRKILFKQSTLPSVLQKFGIPSRNSSKETIYNSPKLSKSHKPTPTFLDNVKQTSQQNLPYKPQSISKGPGIYKIPQYLSPLTSSNIGPESNLLPCSKSNLVYHPSTSKKYSIPNSLSSAKMHPDSIQESYQKQERPIAYPTSTRVKNQVKISKTNENDIFKLPGQKHPDTSWLSPSLLSTEYQQTEGKDIIPYSNQIVSQALPSQNFDKPESYLTRRIPVQSPSKYVNPRNKMVIKNSNNVVPVAQEHISSKPFEPTIETRNEVKRINEIHRPKFLVPETQKLYEDSDKNTARRVIGELEPTNLYLQQLRSTQQAPTFLTTNKPPVNDLKQEVLFKQPAILSDSPNFNILLGQHPSTSYNSPNLLEPSNQAVQEVITPSTLNLQPKQLAKTMEMVPIFQPQFIQTPTESENDDVYELTLDTSSILNNSIGPNKLLTTFQSDHKIMSKLKPEKDSVVNTPLTKNLYSFAQTENIEGPEKINPMPNSLNKKQASKLTNLPSTQSTSKDYEINRKPQYFSPLTSLNIGPELHSPPSLHPTFVYPPSIPLKYSIPNTDSTKKSYQKQKGPLFYSTSPRDTKQLKPNEYNYISRLPQIKSHLKYSLKTNDHRTSNPDSNNLNKQLPEQVISSKEIYNPQNLSKSTIYNPLKASMLPNSQLFGIQSPLGAIHKSPLQQSLQELTPITLSDGQKLTYNRAHSNTPNLFHNLDGETLTTPLHYAANTPSTFGSEPKQLTRIFEKIHPKNSLVLEKPILVQTDNNVSPMKTTLMKPDLEHSPCFPAKTVEPENTGNIQTLSSRLNKQNKTEKLFTTPHQQRVFQRIPSPPSPQASILSSNFKDYPNTVTQIPQYPSKTFTPLDSHQINNPMVIDKSPSAFNSNGYVFECGTSPAVSSKTFSIPLQNDKLLESKTNKAAIPNSSLQLIPPFKRQGTSSIQFQESEFPYLSPQSNIEFSESSSFNQPLSHEILKPSSLSNENSDKSKASRYNLWPVDKSEEKATKSKTQSTLTPNEYNYSPKLKSRLTSSESSVVTSSTPGSATTSPGSITLSAPVTISNNTILNRSLPLQTKIEQNPYLHSLLNNSVITSSNQGVEYVPSEPSLELYPSTVIVENNEEYKSPKYTAYEDKIPNYADHNVPVIGSSHKEGSLSSKSSYISSPPEIVIEALPKAHDETLLKYQYSPTQVKHDPDFEERSVQNTLGIDALSKDYRQEESTPNESENYNPLLFESKVSSPPLKTNSILEAIRQSLSNSESPLNAKICELNTDFKTKEITIPLGELGIAKYEPINIHEFCLKTDNPDIFLQAWNSKLKVIKPKLIFEVKDYEAINFMPVVKNNYYPPELVQDIAKDVITKLYSEPIVIHGVYSYYKPYAIVDHVNYNFMRNGCAYILWPTFCDCGCMQSGCTCRYQ